jgi:hypothetical protein
VAIAPAAPAVPALAYLVVGLLALLAWAIQRGLLAVWVHSFGAMLQGLANLLRYDRGVIHLDFGGPIRALDATVRNTLVRGAQKSEHVAGYFFHGCAQIARWMARETEQLAADTLAWATWLQHAHLPKWVRAVVYATFPPAAIYKLVQAAIHANLPHVGRTVTTKVEHVVTHTVTRIVRASSGAVAIPGWAVRLPGRVGHLERDLSGLKTRLRELEKGAAIAVTAGLALRLLRKLKLGCLAGRNGKKVAQRLCGIDPGLIDALLVSTTLIVGTISLRDFAREMEAVTEEAAGLVRGFIRET